MSQNPEKSPQDIFSDNLRKALTDKGVSESELSERTGISFKTISGYCNYAHIPNGLPLLTIADTLDISLDALFGRKPNWEIGEGDGVFAVSDIERIRMIFQEAERQNRNATVELEYCEKKQQDILHELELTEADYHEGAKLSRELAEIRRRRRNAKNLIELTGPVVKWLSEQSGAMSKLSNVIGQMRKIDDRQKNAVYYVRTGENAGMMIGGETK